MNITAAQRKMVQELHQAKGRRQHGMFAVEGWRAVSEILGTFPLRQVFATSSWVESNKQNVEQLKRFLPANGEILLAKNDELARMSSLTTPQGVIVLFELPGSSMSESEMGFVLETLHKPDGLVIALDRVQDPGNLGTIIRLADWYGLRYIIASPDTVDSYSPKVVQSTMGALARVKVIYTSLTGFLSGLPPEVSVYGTFLDGQNIYDSELTHNGVIVMGNEGNGISPEVGKFANRRLKIPSYPTGNQTVESLNVAVATAITVAEFRRQTSKI